MVTSRRSVITGLGSSLFLAGGVTTVSAEEDDQLSEVEEFISGFGEEIYETTAEAPEALVEFASQLDAEGEFNLEKLEEEIDDGHRQTYRLQHLAQLLNQELGTSLPTSYIDDINVTTGKLNSHLPIIASGQNLIEAGNEYQIAREEGVDTQEAEEELMISVLLFCCELYLLQSTTVYQLSFSGTRYVANTGLVRFRGVLGLRGYALILSEVHWAIRGTIVGVIDTIIRRTKSILRDNSRDLIEMLGRSGAGELTNLIEDQEQLDYDFLEEEPEEPEEIDDPMVLNESGNETAPPAIVAGDGGNDATPGFGIVATGVGLLAALRVLTD
ncbi:hypothetical protein GS429_08435 [Natronorubrum sp. JWXQ-INN-674]|uniref:Uncharacterized protein n=1 Tax=Natronorubrum halalkaliphilum TaxID=2691917 RepID=A0A6B0VLY0_9EURY|nr:hypothetical protein [Natronorubrum halalkaliphilum]MXV62087.1 hypothetical protein [Natronorubrum halalkaliphilum]